MSSLSEACKLVGPKNYVVWKFYMKPLLLKEDLWKLVTIKPQEATHVTLPLAVRLAHS